MATERPDREALFAELFAYYPGVVAYLHRCGFTPDEAADLAQDVFVRVIEHMETYRGEAPWGFVKTVARTIALNRIRANATIKRSAHLVPMEAVGDVAGRHVRTLDNKVADRERVERIYLAVDRLDYNHRIIMLLDLFEFSYDEIGELLGISQSTVKSRLHAARIRVRELLEAPQGAWVVSDGER